MERQKRRIVLAALVAALALTTALAGAPVASAKTEKLTGHVATSKNRGQNGIKVVIALRKGRKSVGSLHFPGCAGANLSIICGGTLNLTGLGSGLSVLFTWICHVRSGGGISCGNSVSSPISDAAGANKGSVTMKIGPPGIGQPLQKGKNFSVKVHPA
jgi:hypothetical protein